VVHTERARGQLAHQADLASQLVRRAAEAADDAEASGIAHGGDELRGGVLRHPGLEERDFDLEQMADGCVKASHCAYVSSISADPNAPCERPAGRAWKGKYAEP
jgi:hypothetical protein